jgi:metal-responsive CopG/Arc/MetJ family transcriptional regulator
MKIQISIDEKLVKRIDDYASKNYMSRSGFISLATSQYLNQNDVLSLFQELTIAVRKIGNTGTIDEDTKKLLEDFQHVYDLYNKA